MKADPAHTGRHEDTSWQDGQMILLLAISLSVGDGVRARAAGAGRPFSIGRVGFSRLTCEIFATLRKFFRPVTLQSGFPAPV
jgi:hypothetical protein